MQRRSGKNPRQRKAKKSLWHKMSGSCPACGLIFRTSSNMTAERKPRAGDATVCTRCGEILIFDVGLAVRRPTVLEMIGFQEAPQWPALERTARFIKVRRPFQKFQSYRSSVVSGFDWDGDGRVCANCLQRPCRCPVYRYGEEPDGEGGGPGA